MMTHRYRHILLLILVSALAGCTGTKQSVQSSMAETISAIKSGNAEEYADAAYAAKDYTAAFAAYQKAAEAGGRYSQFMLANMYLAGEGVKRDPKQYLHWMRQAADAGYPPANYLMGRAYLRSNPTQAVQYFTVAAEREHGIAMHMLGLMYASGTGVEQNNIEALRWFRMAAAQGIPVQKKFLSEAGIQDYRNTVQRSTAHNRKADVNRQQLVREIQQRLTDLGYQPGVADGVFGRKTRLAIEAFQRASGLDPDGQATATLLEALNKQGN